MSHEEESVTTWLGKLKAGHSEAAEQLWKRYVEKLVRLAKRKLGSSPRRVADEEDVVLSAFDGFLKGVDDGRFLKLDDRDDLWQVLVMLTERRAIAQRRRERALKRGRGEVRGESVFEVHEGNGSEKLGIGQVHGHDASPAFAAEMTENVRHLLAKLPHDLDRQVAMGKLEGRSNEELAKQLGIGLRSVERKLAKIRDTWRGEYPNE